MTVKYEKLRKIGFQGAVEEMERAYYVWDGATEAPSVVETLRNWLTSKGYTNKNVQEALYEYFGGLGYTGGFSDRWYAYWLALEDSPGDPDFPMVGLLINFDYSEEIVDKSTNPKSVGKAGKAKRVAQVYKWGDAAVCTTNDGYGYLHATWPAPNGLRLSNQDWCIEFWCLTRAFPEASYFDDVLLSTKYPWLNLLGTDGNNECDYANDPDYSFYTPLGLWVYSDGSILAEVDISIANAVGLASAPGVIKLNRWQHIALSRIGNVLNLYVDGTRVATFGLTGSIPDINGQIQFGWSTDFERYITPGYEDYYWMDGCFDDIRITIGSSRYSGATLTVPPLPFPVETGTNYLLAESGDNLITEAGDFIILE